MKVRAYDSTLNAYFKSEVYAKINTGWYEKQLLLVPSDGGSYIKLFDFIDKSNENHPALINTIIPDIPSEWVNIKSGSVNKLLKYFTGLLDSDMLFFSFFGYSWIYENKSIMVELLKGKSIPYKNSIFENKIASSDICGWNYIETQEDAESLMEQVSGFHDSVLKELNYISGAYVDSNKSMYPKADLRKVAMCFESQWCQPIEMIFEGVTTLNLRPSGDNYDSIIFGASLYVKDASVFFCDDYLEKIDRSYEGTWITAYSLRWRFITDEI
ncbi:MAG: hypothetical protein PHY15_02785 [Eubacteriales bacterium]|nr:hypothetical protein [Eubacteriales bacterium]MDD4475708.1 hypothetical protein [Eubacteriales bacterium]